MIRKGATMSALAGLAMAWVANGCRMTQGNAESANALKPLTADFYVAGNGNDAWSGKLAEPTPDRADGPFRTLEHARDEVRRLKIARTETGKGVTVLIRGGVYTFRQTFTLDVRDSGTADAPVVYQARPGEKVIFVGGPAVPPTALTR